MSDTNKKGKKGQGAKESPAQEKKTAAPEKKAPAQEKKPAEKKVEPAADTKVEKKQEEKVATAGGEAAPVSQKPANPSAGEKKESRVQTVKNETGKGIVKAVLSGDTVVVINLSKNQQGPPQERIVSLSGVKAPTMARIKDDKETPAQPFAWASREFLRKLLIGKHVVYVVEARNEKKDYGTLFLENDNVSLLVLKAGWARIPNIPRKDSPLYEAMEPLIQAEEEAKNAGRGIHDKANEANATVKIIRGVNPTEQFPKLKGQPLTGIVEQVKHGHALRVTLLPKFLDVQIMLSGVECPSSGPQRPEAFGREAKFFTEHHLLNREVSIILEGADKQYFYGTVSLGGKYISTELLRQGLGKYVDWSGMRTNFQADLKKAEAEAKEHQIRLWQSFVAPKPLSRQEEKKALKPGKEILGTVTEIVNSGCVVIQDGNGNLHKIYLSSVRVPSQGAPNAKEETKAETKDRFFAAEGKEFLRKRLIGNKVRCVLDYIREGPKEKSDERTYCSVYLDKNNVAVELVEHGLATAQEHRGGEPRSRDFEHILFADQRAKKGGKGVHSVEDRAVITNVVDVSADAKLSKQKFPTLQRHGRIRGVVEFVISPSRYKILVPKENSLIVLSLAGIQTPLKTSEFYDPALAYVRSKIHQRDIEFDVVQQETKGTGYIGNVWIGKQSVAPVLLEAGYASIFRSADRDAEMLTSESIAKKKHLGIWRDYDEKEEEERLAKLREARESVDKSKPKQEFINVIVTEIVDATHFWVQIVTPEAEKLEELMKNLAEEANGEPYTPKENELVKAQFTADDTWYRAKILKVVGDDEFKVQYVDYGNTEVIPSARIRKLAPEFKTLEPQAVEAVLAFLKAPGVDEDFGGEAVEFFRELVWGKTMMANVERRDKDSGSLKLHLSLGDRESQVLVNAALLRAGLARVERVRGREFKEMIDKLKDEESKAKSAHLGVWEYGDPGSDEDDDEKRGKGKKRT